MAMNKYMHPRNPYKRAPDFVQLTLKYPDLRKYVKPDLSGKVKINFKCEGAVRELTKCLLHKDFGLTIDLPPNRLVPTLPLRMNYLLWIEDLLNESGKQFHGVDIGTGASCIYPLLATKYFNWKMTATEIDQESITYAIKNIEKNNLKDFIQVKPVKDAIMLDGALDEHIAYDFCMCNPPFYSEESEISGKARTDRRAPPRNHRSGQNFELVAPGGETAFISRIIDDSVKLGSRIRVYTVMVGHKSNLNKVKELVKEAKPYKMRTTEFCQGRTTRWGMAWTFSEESSLISTAIQPRKEQSKPPFRWVYPGKCNLHTVIDQVINILNSLKIDVNVIENEEGNCGMCIKAYENTWSHSRRKRREERRRLIDKQVLSPCDSVVTINDSVDSNNPLSPSSPIDSLGYSSFSDADDKIIPTHTNDSNCMDDLPTTSFQSQLATGRFDKNTEDISLKQSSNATDEILTFLNDSEHKSSVESQSDMKKRKLECPDPIERKRVKRSIRPILEAVLVLSVFEGDIIFSLSFVDGTGGRESANQVLQYLKNKLS